MKRIRQAKILELIDQYEIETQEELAKRLLGAGLTVTQATISRDIRELSLTKVPGSNGRPKYVSAGQGNFTAPVFSDRYARVLQDGMLSIEQADNIVVIKTVSGMAMAVAAAIDALGIDGIVGSIAGDDTIMCAVKTASMVSSVMEQIKEAKK